MNLDKLIHISTYAGRIMLENGAEIYRVEETIIRICEAYGVSSTESFVTPTGIIVSISNNNNTVSLVKRIRKRKVDLNKIHAVNDLARRIISDKISLDDFYQKLIYIEKEKGYDKKLVILLSGLSAACFSLIMGGRLHDFIATFFIGILIKIISLKFLKLSINEFFINYTGGALAATMALLFFIFDKQINVDKTIIGAIMLLVPGLAITNAIRDIIAGDFLAGLTKAAEAFLIAISIAAGSGTILSIWINTLGGKLL